MQCSTSNARVVGVGVWFRVAVSAPAALAPAATSAGVTPWGHSAALGSLPWSSTMYFSCTGTLLQSMSSLLFCAQVSGVTAGHPHPESHHSGRPTIQLAALCTEVHGSARSGLAGLPLQLQSKVGPESGSRTRLCAHTVSGNRASVVVIAIAEMPLRSRNSVALWHETTLRDAGSHAGSGFRSASGSGCTCKYTVGCVHGGTLLAYRKAGTGPEKELLWTSNTWSIRSSVPQEVWEVGRNSPFATDLLSTGVNRTKSWCLEPFYMSYL